jgi:hypothetical protein
VPFRSLKTLSTWTLALAVGFAASSSLAAGKKDKEALKLHDQAMDEDYLSLELDKAEEKLQKALKACGKDACSGPVVGKIWVALATVHGVGQQKLDVAKSDLVNALKADPGAKLLDGLSTPELEAKYAEAKSEAGGGGSGDSTEPTPPDGGEEPKPQVGGDFNHTPIAESAVHTPVPIFAEIPEELGASKVVLRYKPYGGTKWVSLPLEAMEGGFGGEVPCDAVTTSGELKYYIIGTDDTGTPVATAGSTKNPFKISIKNKISGDAPSLPGKKPPTRCQAKEDCPPGLPGCAADGGGKAEGALCDSLAECASGLMCSSDGVCVPGEGDDSGPSKGGKNLVSIGAQFDLALISSAEGVCNASNSATFTCFRQDSGDQFYGFPANVNGTNGIAGGLGLGSVRLLAGYDRFLLDGLGLAVGARVGFALGGSPSPQTDPPNGDINGDDQPDYAVPPRAKDFLPLHLEGRASYHFLGEGNVEAGQLRPFAFVGGGIAQVNASVPVTVCDQAVEGASGRCPGETTVDAYQLTGLGFVGFGGGATYMLVDNFGVSAEVKFMIMLPTSGFVIAPVIAPVVAF